MDSPSSQSRDVYSLSDQALSGRLEFIEEIGFGNWGSVWLCRPKSDPASNSSPTKYKHVKIAVKLVHRSKTQTTAARVRSLWNEMKVVRSLKDEQHPSIVPFYSFIITPSYALITMAFLPRLVPVEVDEPLAKQWFRSLLSGVEFLHLRGVVHNDIKPANILLSDEEVPILVDFGFAEKYEQDSSKAFKSNLAYGTPEYLSPERARGLYHDTRKSDVWSLGVTFFEILIGRTPFEYVEGEQFSTKEDLEKYWARTLRGKWVGSWKMSKGVEKMLRRMITPNTDVRCSTSELMEDPYWCSKEVNRAANRKSASAAFSAMSIDIDASKFLDIVSPFTTRTLNPKKETSDKSNKENLVSPANRNTPIKVMKQEPASIITSRSKNVRPQSQPKTMMSAPQNQTSTPSKSPGLKPLTFAPMAPIKGSTTSSIVVIPSTLSSKTSPNGKEKVTPSAKPKLARVASDSRTRKPVGPRKAPLSPDRPKKMSSVKGNRENENPVATKSRDKENSVPGRQGRVLMDLSMNSNVNNSTRTGEMDRSGVNSNVGKSSVKDRWLDWERERERLREMDRLQEKVKEAEEETEKERVAHEEEEARAQEEREHEAVLEAEREKDREMQRQRELEEQRRKLENELKEIQCRSRENLSAPFENDYVIGDREVESGLRDGLPRPQPRESSLSILKTSLITTIERGVQMYKTSTPLAYIGKQSTKLFSEPDNSHRETSTRRSWEDESLVRQADSSSPAVQDERLSQQTQEDRMKLWIKNVDKVVEDVRKGFVVVPTTPAPSPSLPVAPSSRRSSQMRTARVPRKILAASQIFSEDGDASTSSLGQTRQGQSLTDNSSVVVVDRPLSTIESDSEGMKKLPTTPPMARRATVMTLSRENRGSVEVDNDCSPSSWKEKSKSHSHLLLAQPITALDKLELELERLSAPSPPLRLSAVVDASLFITSPASSKDSSTMEVNDLTCSPCRVEPYPARPYTGTRSLDSPNTKRRVESRYEQLVTSKANVRKVGMGYQSDSREAVAHMAELDPSASTTAKRNLAFFHSIRRDMPPPTSSDDRRKTMSVDELRNIATPSKPDSGSKEDRIGTSSVVRRAFNIMTGKNNSRRLSRIG